jgi:phytoene dehydrogenase-like protein
MTERIIIVGGGHNGLVCAAYLARAGKQVLVLEAADTVGGAARTREFAPGFQVSACAHLLLGLDPRVTRELNLAHHGLSLVEENLGTVALAEDGQHLTIRGDRVDGTMLSSADQAAFRAYHGRMARFAALLAKLYGRRPPRLGGGDWTDLLGVGRMGLDIRLLGREDMREFLRIAGINIFDVLEESLRHPLLKGALALDAVLGSHLGPRSNNSVLTALHRLSRGGRVAQPAGGMGTVSAALSAAAQDAGADVRTGATVARIVVEAGRATGVVLGNGESLAASAVVSNADPKTTFLNLVGAPELETGFASKIHHVRMRGDAAKLHLALDGLPTFTHLAPTALAERLVIAPDLPYVERAFDHAKYGEYSAHPVLEVTVPTIKDPSLAPDGKHVLSAIVQYAPYEHKESWAQARAGFLQVVMDTLARYAPDLPGQVSHAELLTPADIEAEFGINGGHWHHGELALDQFLMLRPVPGAAQYHTPVDGLYLCGAGAHPGGGVMGTAGANAAAAVIAREKRP